MYSSIWPASILSFLEADLLVLPRLSKSNHIATCTELESSGIQQRIDKQCPKKTLSRIHQVRETFHRVAFLALASLLSMSHAPLWHLFAASSWSCLGQLAALHGDEWKNWIISLLFFQVLNGPHSLQKGHPVAVCRFTLQDCFNHATDVDHCKHLFSLGGILDTCVYFEYIMTIQNTTTCIYTEFTCRLYIGAAFMESRSYYVVKKSPFKRYHVQVQYCVMLTLDS